jgi:hypothetical protein
MTVRAKKEETPMPELLIDFITSLDGYGAFEGWPGWWALEGLSGPPAVNRGVER